MALNYWQGAWEKYFLFLNYCVNGVFRVSHSKVCKAVAKRGDENPAREKEMDSPSFEGFWAHLDCKLTYGNRNQTQLTLVYSIYSSVQKQNRKKQ